MVISRGGCGDRFAHKTFSGGWFARSLTATPLCIPRPPENMYSPTISIGVPQLVEENPFDAVAEAMGWFATD